MLWTAILINQPASKLSIHWSERSAGAARERASERANERLLSRAALT